MLQSSPGHNSEMCSIVQSNHQTSCRMTNPQICNVSLKTKSQDWHENLSRRCVPDLRLRLPAYSSFFGFAHFISSNSASNWLPKDLSHLYAINLSTYPSRSLSSNHARLTAAAFLETNRHTQEEASKRGRLSGSANRPNFRVDDTRSSRENREDSQCHDAAARTAWLFILGGWISGG